MTTAAEPRTADRPGTRIDAYALALGLSGALLTLVYAAASARIPLDRYFPEAGITVDFVKMLASTWERTTVLYVGMVCTSFVLYALALWATWRQGASAATRTWALFGFPAVFALVLLPMYPPTAMDMFHYHAMGRIFWIHGANPLTTVQSAFPYPIGMSWDQTPSLYGAVWSLLVWPASKLPGENLLAGLLAFKALAAVSLFGCAWLIWTLVRRLRPGDEALAVVLFAWNPFVLLRVAGNGHNDLWMMLFALLAFERAERRSWHLAVVCLALSVLVKFTTALLAPLLLIYMWKHADGSRRKRLLLLISTGALAVAVTAASYAPFWAGRDTFSAILKQSSQLITSTPLLLGLWLTDTFDAATAARYHMLLPRLVFAGLYLPLVWQARRSFEHLIVASFTSLFLYLLVATAWYRPWYMLWPVALAALLPRTWLGATLIAITLAGSFPDVVEQFRSNWTFLSTYQRVMAAPVLVAFLPPLAVWMLGVVRHRGWSLGAKPSGP